MSINLPGRPLPIKKPLSSNLVAMRRISEWVRKISLQASECTFLAGFMCMVYFVWTAPFNKQPEGKGRLKLLLLTLSSSSCCHLKDSWLSLCFWRARTSHHQLGPPLQSRNLSHLHCKEEKEEMESVSTQLKADSAWTVSLAIGEKKNGFIAQTQQH